MNIADKLITIAENEQKVYDAGVDEGIDAMWEALQCGGKRTEYNSSLFDNIKWDKKSFRPKYPIKFSSCYELMYKIVHPSLKSRDDQISIKKMEAEKGFVIFDTSNITNFGRAFTSLSFKDYGTIDISKATYTSLMFYGGYVGATQQNLLPSCIEHLICSATTTFDANTFGYASELEYIGFEGTISKSGLNLQWSTKLNKDSITKLIGVLDAEATEKTVTLSQKAKENAFTEEEWATLIATKPNWTIALV